METFGGVLAVNDVDIDTFFKYTHSKNNARVSAQRILIINNVFFELKDIELYNALPGELYLRGINADQLSIMRNNRADSKEYLKRRYNQYNTDRKYLL